MSGGRGESADDFVDGFMVAYLPYHLPVHLPTPHPSGIKCQLNLKLLHLLLDPSSELWIKKGL